MSNLIPASGFGAGSARAAGSGLVSSVTGSGGRSRGLARAVQRELEWTAGRGDVVRAVDAARAELTNGVLWVLWTLLKNGISRLLSGVGSILGGRGWGFGTLTPSEVVSDCNVTRSRLSHPL